MHAASINNDEDALDIRRIEQTLQKKGYCVVPNVLKKSECIESMEHVWDFMEDTTYGAMNRKTSEVMRVSTNSAGWNSNVKANERDVPSNESISDFAISDYYQQSNGAGWLLWDIREILAKRVFQPLLGTRELLSSKEGFVFCAQKPTNIQDEGNKSALFKTRHHGSQNCLESNMNQIELSVSVYDKNCNRIVRCIASLDATAIISTQPNLQGEQVTELISLERGALLVWFPGAISFDRFSAHFSQNRAVTLLFCSIQNLNVVEDMVRTSILKQQMQSYKQRQTESFLALDDNLFLTSKKDAGRSYFRTGPAMLTIRQAELAGLLDYSHNDNCPNDVSTPKIRLENALIQGVRFRDICNSEICASSLVSESISMKHNLARDDAHLVFLKGNNENECSTAMMAGQDKYLGGMSSACGRYVYGVPGGASRVLRINVEDGQIDWIGPSFAGKFKWLRGLAVAPAIMKKFVGTADDDDDNTNMKLSSFVEKQYPAGCCFALPCNSPSILKINPETSTVYSFGKDVIQHCGSTSGWYYHGGNLSSINGWIYCIPANANRVMKFHPVTDECMYIGPTFSSEGIIGQRWFGGIEGHDKCIYGIPHNERGVLKINPRTDEVSIMYLNEGKLLPEGQWKWHGGLRAGNKIFGFPNNADNVLVINCDENRVYTIGHSLQSGCHRIPQDGRYKYLGGAATLDESFAYLFPCDAERVLRINCITDEVQLVGPSLLDGENKFQNGFCCRDGCLYGIPQRASGVLRIIPWGSKQYNKSTDIARDDCIDVMDCGVELIGVKDKFEGGVLGSDGCVYCIPLRSKICVKIVPANVNLIQL